MNDTEAVLSLIRAKSLVNIDRTVVDDRGIAFGDLQQTTGPRKFRIANLGPLDEGWWQFVCP
jgi:hypothetical protein